MPFESCIPAGDYPLVLGRFNKGGYAAYELRNVPGRDLIKIHKANLARELLGCIAPGVGLGFMTTDRAPARWALTSSGMAFNAFMEAMDGAKTGMIRIRYLDQAPDFDWFPEIEPL